MFNKPTQPNMPVLIFIVLLTFFSACGLFESDNPEPLEPGPRNYEWTVDTLNNGPGFIYDIWGSSPKNIWAVSTGGIHHIWHFDGNTWAPYQETNFSHPAETVFGFSQNNVWVGGNGNIFHFDGNTWKLSFKFEKPGMHASFIADIWGDSPSNLYAVGAFYMSQEAMAQGFILHYNGKEWRELLTTNFGVQFQRIRIEKGVPVLLGSELSDDKGIYKTRIYYFNNNSLNKKIIKNSSQSDALSMNDIGCRLYYVRNNSIYTFDNNKFFTALNSNFGYQIYGRHEKDIFFRMGNGLAHYNGDDVQYMFNVNPPLLTVYFNAMLFKNEVFFIVLDFDVGTNYIYHGTLTEQEEE